MQAYTKQFATFSDSQLGASEFEGVAIRLLGPSRFISSGMLHLEFSHIRGQGDGVSLKWRPFSIMSCKGK